MGKKQILVAGGYGSVGTHISSILSKNDSLIPVVAGRSKEKAMALAKTLDCRWKTIDLCSKKSIEETLTDIDIVVNCYIPSNDFNIFLPELAAASGIHYVDIGAFNNYNEGVAGINKNAVENDATLITSLGLYPGMPGLIIAENRDYFDQVDTADIFFTSGSNMENLTPLALQGIAYMMGVTPTQWEGEQWIKAPGKGRKEYISEPFNRKITFYPYMVTYDLLKIPEIMKINKMVMWSMSESFLMGMILLLGLKMGLAKTIERADKFLSILRFLGRNGNEDYSMKIVTKGYKNNEPYERVVEMNATEEYLTAIVPAIICEQLADGEIVKRGAFTGAEVVNLKKFTESLKTKAINYEESMKKL